MTAGLPRALFVGAFPPAGASVVGGMVTSCRLLLESSLPSRVVLDLFDSTQISNPPPPLAVRLARAAARFVQYVRRFEKQRPDVVLLFVALGGSILDKGLMAWYARLRGVPVVMFPRGGAVIDDCRTSWLTRLWVRACFRGARTIVCQSEVWRQFAIEVLGFQSSNVVVMRNWTATRSLLEIGAGRATRTGSPVRLLFLGWLERDKGIFELLQACGELLGERDFTLDIAGDGHAAQEARALVCELGLTSIVRFRGWLRGADLHDALRAADVLVLPSWAEGLPNAMVEAMSAKLAIVVSAVGAIPEIITNGVSGLLVEPRNPKALAAALSSVTGDPQLRERLAGESHRIAVQEFAAERAASRLAEVIGDTVAAGRAGRLSGHVH